MASVRFEQREVHRILGIPENARLMKSCLRSLDPMADADAERASLKSIKKKPRKLSFKTVRNAEDRDISKAYKIISLSNVESTQKRTRLSSKLTALADSVDAPQAVRRMDMESYTELQYMLLADAMFANSTIWYDFIFSLLKRRAGEIKLKHNVSSEVVYSNPMCLDDDDDEAAMGGYSDWEDEFDDSYGDSGVAAVAADGRVFHYESNPRKRHRNALMEFKAVCHTISLCTEFLFTNPGHFLMKNAKDYGYPLALPNADLKVRRDDGSWPVSLAMVDRAWAGLD